MRHAKLSLCTLAALPLFALAAQAGPCGEAVEHVKVKMLPGQTVWTACKLAINDKIFRARPTRDGHVICTVHHSAV